MAYLPENPAAYPAGITQIEVNEPAVGGATGVANRALIELASRTAYLKSATDAHDAALDDAALLAQITGIDGAGSGIDADLIRGLDGDFSRSLLGIGYQRLPGGLIVQWGSGTGDPSGIVTVPLPIAFPTALLWAVGGDIALSDGEARSHVVSWRKSASTPTQLKFITVAAADGAFEGTHLSWLALGY